MNRMRRELVSLDPPPLLPESLALRHPFAPPPLSAGASPPISNLDGRAMTRLVIGAVCWAILLTVLVYGLTFTAPAIRPMHPVEVHCTAAPGYVLADPCTIGRR
jgi:hypothetical protein